MFWIFPSFIFSFFDLILHPVPPPSLNKIFNADSEVVGYRFDFVRLRGVSSRFSLLVFYCCDKIFYYNKKGSVSHDSP